MARWTLDDIPWERFDRAKVDPDILRIVKAASLVEQNGADYAHYLCNVFADDPGFPGRGAALGRGGDPARPGARPLGGARRSGLRPCRRLRAASPRASACRSTRRASVRGSRAGELVARCIVETGTSSYYTALAEADDGAGAEGDLPPHRRRRAPPLQALPHPSRALSRRASGWVSGAGCASRSAASPKPRTTSSPSPITRPTSPRGPMTAARAARAYARRAYALIAGTMSSAASP